MCLDKNGLCTLLHAHSSQIGLRTDRDETVIRAPESIFESQQLIHSVPRRTCNVLPCCSCLLSPVEIHHANRDEMEG